MKEQREADGLAGDPCDHCLGIDARPEHRFAQIRPGRDDLMRELFVVGELADEAQNDGHVVGDRGGNMNVGHGLAALWL